MSQWYKFYIVLKSLISFCFQGTGTNVCYMENIKNIEKTERKHKGMEREEGTPEGEDDMVDL